MNNESDYESDEEYFYLLDNETDMARLKRLAYSFGNTYPGIDIQIRFETLKVLKEIAEKLR